MEISSSPSRGLFRQKKWSNSLLHSIRPRLNRRSICATPSNITGTNICPTQGRSICIIAAAPICRRSRSTGSPRRCRRPCTRSRQRPATARDRPTRAPHIGTWFLRTPHFHETRMGVRLVTLSGVSFSTTVPLCTQQCASNGPVLTPITQRGNTPYCDRNSMRTNESNRHS